MTLSARFVNGRVFDGAELHEDHPLSVFSGEIIQNGGEALEVIDLVGDILAPGFVDLQVNGGGGVLLNDAPTPETLARIARAHRALGATSILPTLITDRPETLVAAVTATKISISAQTLGIAGLHLEGPHLDPVRCGAHDPSMIRPMTEADLEQLLAAASLLPCLKVTLAPESATEAQVRRLAEAGVYVALGHTNCDAETALRYFAAGARGATHLFNAMSQMQHRAPGLVGAVLATGRPAGLIADGHHVHPVAMRAALAANPALFLVSDSMAVAGTELRDFTLNGREILRKNGRLTLADGTLAGADLDLVQAISVLVRDCGVPLADALARATSLPARVAGLEAVGHLRPGEAFRAVRLRPEADGSLRLVQVYG